MPALLVLTVVIAVDPERRVYLVPGLLVLFGYAFWKNAVGALTIVAFMLGFPVYVRLWGRDAGVLTTFLILEMYALAMVRKGLSRESGLLLPAVVLLLIYAYGTIGMPTGDMLLRSLRMLLGLATGFMMMHLILTYVRTEATVAALFRSLLVMLVLQAAIAAVQASLTGSEWAVLAPFSPRERGTIGPGDAFRATGAMGDYELLAEWFAGFTPIALCIAYAGRTMRSRAAGILLIITSIAGILATGTRGGLVAAAMGSIVFLALLARRSAGQALRLALVLPLILGIPLLVAALALPSLTARVMSRMEESGHQFTTNFYGFSDREGFLVAVVRALNRDRWLILPSFITELHFLPYGFFPLEALDYAGAGSLHSLWLTLWFQGGVTGSVAWAWFAFASWRFHSRLSSPHRLRYVQLLSVGLIAGLTAMLTSEIKVEFLRSEHSMAFFFLMLGLSIAVSRIGAQRPPLTTSQEVSLDAHGDMGA